MNSQKSAKILIWFRNDLRLHDHEPLHKAFSKTEEIIPVYCFDPRQFQRTELGFPKTDYFRARFLIESVKDLRKNLQKLGGDLVVRIGQPEEVIPDLAKHLGVTAVYASKEVTDEEIKVEEKLESALWKENISLETFWNATLFHIEDLPYPTSNLPDVFTQFRKSVEKGAKVRSTFAGIPKIDPLGGIPVGDIPSYQELGLEAQEASSLGVLPFEGGESKGLQRLHYYIWEQELIKDYKQTRNGLLGGDYSSKFSPWLAHGCLSPRRIYEEVKRFEQKVHKNQSTYWLIFELIWRDYFRFVAHKYGNRIFQLNGIKNSLDFQLKDHHKLFEKWKEGRTGVPFIDANMRELNETGFMSNRGRQNVASFLVKDLRVNWTWGAAYFESKLIDYDVCSNWGNWTYVAGVGNDPRENRYFNIMSQAKRYDPKGEYVKHWLPELENVPANAVHHPRTLNNQELKEYDVVLGVDYPNSLVDFNNWLR